ncbi:MAG TPA: hypothetical protein VGF17_14195 [Phytomonospora sp.]
MNALATLVQTTPIVYASITGLRESDLDFLHDDLLDRSTAYLGFLSLDDRLPAHVEFYGGFPQYRVLGAELRLLYSAAEYSPEFGIEDTRPSDALAEWRDAGMFSRVDWEEDEEHSRHARKIAEQYADWLLNGGSSGEPPP